MSEETDIEKKEAEGEDTLSKLLMVSPPAEPEMRSMSIIGDINEELSKDILAALWFLNHTAKVEEPANPEDPECDEMFAIYDTMRYIRETVDIETFGLGKVMSAGTLLLAAGTKGKRRIGKHCRVMIHSVIGGSVGPMHQLDNEMKEVKSIQESYIRAICEETNLTERKLRALLKKKMNIYLTAEEAVEYGFADIVI